MIFDSATQTFRLFVTFGVALTFGFVLMSLVGESLWQIIIGTVTVLSVTVVGYRLFGLIHAHDVLRYFGQSNRASRFVIKVLCASQDYPFAGA